MYFKLHKNEYLRIKKKFAIFPVALSDVDLWVWLGFYYSHQEYISNHDGGWITKKNCKEIDKEFLK
ncbi:MAG: hypothetical protein ACRDD7_17340 [Peptostreptococcaceae bacterium]